MPRTRRCRAPGLPPCPAKDDDALITMWLHGRPESTQSNYRRDIELLRDCVGVRRLSRLTLADLIAFDRALADRGNSDSSRCRRLCAVRSLLDFAHTVGYLDFNVGVGLRLPKHRDTLADRILSQGEVARLFEASARRCLAVRLPEGECTSADLAEALDVRVRALRRAAQREGWPYGTELRSAGTQSARVRLFAWETIRSFCEPVHLSPGWYSFDEIAKAVGCKRGRVRRVAYNQRWPYRVVVRQVSHGHRPVRVYPAGYAANLKRFSRALRNHSLLAALYYGGFRISEALSLRWEDCRVADDGAAYLTVQGKGDRTRTVRLPVEAWKLIARTRLDAKPGAFVFWGERLSGSLSREHAGRFLKDLAAEAGVDRPLSPHWLRHACASHSHANGCPIGVVKATLGHASLLSTERYIHVSPEEGSGDWLPDPGGAGKGAKHTVPIPLRALAGQAAG